MLRNAARIAIRHLNKNKVVSIINIMGLSLGLATCLVAGLYIKHELSADKFHEDLHSIYRITVQMKAYAMSGTPYLFAETVGKEIPQVQSSVRTADQQTVVRINEESFKNEILFADSNFLTFFTFPLESGNRQKALSNLRQVVISQRIKEKYFDGANPIGETIQIELDNVFEDFAIAGIAKPTPTYSSLDFDFVIPMENRYSKNPGQRNDWGQFFMTTFLKLKPSDVPAVEKAMPQFVQRHFPDQITPEGKPSMNFVLRAFADHHLNEGFPGGGLRQGKTASSLLIFGGIALIILLLACFNFMNLTNAQSSRRAIEVGIKKVVGAGRSQLIRQFLSEAIVLSFIAAGLGLCIAELSLFIFRDLLQISVSLFDLRHVDIYAGLIAITITTGILAGIYPALVLANVRTIGILKKHYRVGGSNWLTRSILSFQFALSIILIVCAIVMWKQQNYMLEKDLGYNEEQVLLINIPQRDTSSINFLKGEIRKLPEVVNVAKTSSALTLGSNATIYTTEDKRSLFLSLISIDEDYLTTLEMNLIQGENFKTGHNRKSAIIVNEKFLQELGLQDSVGIPLGRNISWLTRPTIIGVVKDFHHAAMKYEISPLVFLYNEPFDSFYLMVRLNSGQTGDGLSKIRSLWSSALPNSTFEFSFLDDNVNKQYEADQRWSIIITLATSMAIFLSILGLLGLATFTAEQRKKEIGIRKVLGASLRQIVSLLLQNYLWLIILAFILSIPASYYLMNQYWLSQFAYKIEIGPLEYVATLVIVLLIAGFAVGSQTLRAALQNPVDVLKEE
jgi:putative ABC transport system permease protein